MRLPPEFAMEQRLSARTAQVRARDGTRRILKQAPEWATGIAEAAQSLEREAAILTKLQECTSTTRVLSFDKASAMLVLDWLPGAPIDIRKPRSGPELHQVLLGVFRALASLNPELSPFEEANEVVHCDLSPDNLLVEAGTTFIIDFELAQYGALKPPPDGAFRGTLTYAAPEIARSERATHRSDVFSAAAVVIACARQMTPRRATTTPALLLEVAETPIALPDAVTASMRNLLQRLTHMDPGMRPSARDAVLEIEAW
jgi:eukaryotic-like serine/threonine-protein kinase